MRTQKMYGQLCHLKVKTDIINWQLDHFRLKKDFILTQKTSKLVGKFDYHKQVKENN